MSRYVEMPLNKATAYYVYFMRCFSTIDLKKKSDVLKVTNTQQSESIFQLRNTRIKALCWSRQGLLLGLGIL